MSTRLPLRRSISLGFFTGNSNGCSTVRRASPLSRESAPSPDSPKFNQLVRKLLSPGLQSTHRPRRGASSQSTRVEKCRSSAPDVPCGGRQLQEPRDGTVTSTWWPAQGGGGRRGFLFARTASIDSPAGCSPLREKAAASSPAPAQAPRRRCPFRRSCQSR